MSHLDLYFPEGNGQVVQHLALSVSDVVMLSNRLV